MKIFSAGDVITIKYPARGGVGPVVTSGTVIKDHGDEVEVESGHTRGTILFVKKSICSLITPAAKRGI